jgi:16S rRNA (guanine(1405)-N(7))-methyltransferase
LTELESLVAAVLGSPKYGRLGTDLIYRVGSIELSKRPTFKEAVKATKTKLHQVAGAYLDVRVDYAGWLEQLRSAHQSQDASYQTACRSIMRHQSSTRERLPILARFYQETLSSIAPIGSILDLASGLNPLATSWMPLADGGEYWAYDVYSDLTGFLQEAIALAGLRGGAVCCDVAQLDSAPPADLVLMLKCVPCLDQLDRLAASRLLQTIDAPHVLISFPLQSLGGRGKGMLRNYETRMEDLVREMPWHIQRFEYATELAFLVSK